MTNAEQEQDQQAEAPEITPEMVSEGWRVLDELSETYASAGLVAEIYKAMWLVRQGSLPKA